MDQEWYWEQDGMESFMVALNSHIAGERDNADKESSLRSPVIWLSLRKEKKKKWKDEYSEKFVEKSNSW